MTLFTLSNLINLKRQLKIQTKKSTSNTYQNMELLEKQDDNINNYKKLLFFNHELSFKFVTQVDFLIV